MISCQRAYLVHVDKTYIRKVLTRLRKIGSKNRNLLHKKKLQFKYSEQNQILRLDGNGIGMAIKNYVGESPIRYAEHKLHTFRSIGYENRNKLLKFKISLPDKNTNIEEYFVDFSIGLVSSLQVTEWEENDIRFGIIAENPIKQFETGRLEIDHKPEKGKIVLSSGPNDKQVTIETDVYMPNGIEIQKKNFKIRFSNVFFDLVWCPFKNGKNVNLKFHFPEEKKKYPLTSLKQLADIILFFDRTDKKLIEFRYKQMSPSRAEVTLQSAEIFDQFYIKLSCSIKNAWKISKHFNVHHEIVLTPEEMFNQEVHLQFMENVITRSGGMVKVSIWPEENKKMPNGAKKNSVPFLSHVILGQYQIAISAIIIEGTIFQNPNDDKRYDLISTDVRQCRQYIWDRGTKPPCTEREAIDAVISDFDDLTDVVLLKGIHDHILNNDDKKSVHDFKDELN